MIIRSLLFFSIFLAAAVASASPEKLYLRCFKLLPPDLYVYRNSENGKFRIVAGSMEAKAHKVQTLPKGTFLRFNDGYSTTDLELAVEFTEDPKADRDAEVYLSTNPSRVIDRYSCRPF